MVRTLNTIWFNKQLDTYKETGKLELRLTGTVGLQALVMHFSKKEIPYRITQLGAGVKLFTTDTNICPCCKQKLGGHND